MKIYDIDIRVSVKAKDSNFAWLEVSNVMNLTRALTHKMKVERIGEPIRVKSERCVTCGGSNGVCIIPCHG